MEALLNNSIGGCAAMLTTRNMSKETGATNSTVQELVMTYCGRMYVTIFWDVLIQFGEFLYHATTSILVVIDIGSIHPE